MIESFTHLVKSILAGEVDLKSLTKKQLDEVAQAMALMKAKFVSPDQQKKNKMKATETANKNAMTAAKLKSKPQIEQKVKIKQDEEAKVIPFKKEDAPDLGANAGVVKTDSNGQWKIEKAIKPGKPLDYKEMNTPKRPPEEDATSIVYGGKEPRVTGKQWKSSDSSSMNVKAAQRPDASEKHQRVKSAIKQGKITDKEIKPQEETALDTIKRKRQKPV